jgi:hypothetical protein
MKFSKTSRERFPAASSPTSCDLKRRGTYWISANQYLSVSRLRSAFPTAERFPPIGNFELHLLHLKRRGTYWIFGKQYLSVSRVRSK